jgi:ATP-dependent DNA ligase
VVFDLLWLDGHSLMDEPYHADLTILAKLARALSRARAVPLAA